MHNILNIKRNPQCIVEISLDRASVTSSEKCNTSHILQQMSGRLCNYVHITVCDSNLRKRTHVHMNLQMLQDFILSSESSFMSYIANKSSRGLLYIIAERHLFLDCFVFKQQYFWPSRNDILFGLLSSRGASGLGQKTEIQQAIYLPAFLKIGMLFPNFIREHVGSLRWTS